MFVDASTIDRRQVTGSIKKALKKWADEEHDWLDDRNFVATIESVDKRISLANHIIAMASRAGGKYPSEEFVEVTAELEEQKRSLKALREDLLNGASGRSDGGVLAGLRPTKLASYDEQRWVDLEAAKFVRANKEAIGAREELAERAYRHAERHLGQLTKEAFQRVAQAFVWRVDILGRTAPQPRLASREGVRQDFTDSIIFL